MKQAFVALGIFLVLIILGLAFFVIPKASGLKTGEVQVGNAFFQVEIADTPVARSKGLSGRGFLSEDRGMLFLFPFSGNYGFWMKDMKFPIDIIWIKDNKVVGMIIGSEPEEGEAPTIYNPPESIDKVLEINAGLTQKLGIRVGDEVVIK